MISAKQHYLLLFKRALEDIDKYNYPERMNIYDLIVKCELDYSSGIPNINSPSDLRNRLQKWIKFFIEESE